MGRNLTRHAESRIAGITFVSSLAILLSCILSSGAQATDSPYLLESEVRFEQADLHITFDGEWHRLEMQDGYLDDAEDHIGNPQLPVVTRFFVVPPDRMVERVDIVPTEKVVIPGHFRPLPILAPDAELPADIPWENIVYPRETGSLSTTGQLRRYRVAKVNIFPVEFDATTSELSVIGSMIIRLILRPLSQDEERSSLHFARPNTGDDLFRYNRRWLERVALNPGDIARYYPLDQAVADDPGGAGHVQQLSERTALGSFISERPSRDGLPVDYLIITNNTDEYGNYLGNMEYVFSFYAGSCWGQYEDMAVRTVDWIVEQYPSYDRAGSIKAFLLEAVELWGTSYVLLGGDISIVPTRRLGGPDQDTWNRPDPPGDQWYTRLSHAWSEEWNVDGDAWIGEDLTDIGSASYTSHGFTPIFISRMPARDVGEAEIMTNKVSSYLSYDPNLHWWYGKALAAAGLVFSSDTLSERTGVVAAEHVLAEQVPSNWQVDRLYPFVGGARAPAGTCAAWGDTCYLPLHHYIKERVHGDYWEADDLRDQLTNPSTAPHILFHYDHSHRDILGKPSDKPPAGYGGICTWNTAIVGNCQDALHQALGSVHHLDLNEVMALKNAEDHAQYMFVLTDGCATNMEDMNAIGEAFMRAPAGGAVFFVGKAGETPPETDVFKNTVRIALGEPWEGVPLCVALKEGIHEKYFDEAEDEVRTFAEYNVLGDPQLVPWPDWVDKLMVQVSPNPITALGSQTITATVTDSVTGLPVPDVLVNIKQRDVLAARETTNDQGAVSFKSVSVQDGTDSVYMTVFRPGYVPVKVVIPIQVSAPYIAYGSHHVDDCGANGDCDGVLEAGEIIDLDVTMKNFGTTASQQGFLRLLPTPIVTFDLSINGDSRGQDTLIGKGKALPSAVADTFWVPMTDRGVRTEGEPVLNGSPTHETYRVWRDEASGTYKVGALSASHSSDSVFTGIVRCQSDFTSVTKIGEANDLLYASGDSIWFQFRGDASEDRVQFRAEAPTWLSFSSTVLALPALQPGDSATVSFTATVLHDVPDRANIPLTLTAYQGLMATTYFHSDFVVKAAKPAVDVVGIEREFGDVGCADTGWTWTPIVQNRGSGEADSVRLVLRRDAGSYSVVDSVVTFSRIGADSIASAGSFVLCGDDVADTAGFRATIYREEFHKTQYYDIAPYDGGGGGGPPAPGNLEADLANGSVLLRWTPVQGATNYWIEVATSSSGPRTSLALIGNTATRYEVQADLIAPGGNGYQVPYYFSVRACYRTLCGSRATVGPIFPWVHERPGWPKLLPGRTVCAATVADLNPFYEGAGKIILAGLHRIYAWRPDGSPLIGGDGTLFEPYQMDSPGSDERYTEALTFGDWDTGRDGPEVIGNFKGRGIYLAGISRNPVTSLYSCTGLWSRPENSRMAAVLGADVFPEGRQILFLAGTSDSHIYGWDAGDPSAMIGNSDHQFATYSYTDETYNYRSLALGYHTSEDLDDECHEIISSTSKGRLYCFRTDDLANPSLERWVKDFDGLAGYASRSYLSTPAVGDVDGDGDNDVVVTNIWRQDTTGPCYGFRDLIEGRLFIIDENTGNYSEIESCGFHFRQADNVPAVGPALADLDGDQAMEIILPSASAGGSIDESTYPVSITLNVYDVDNGDITVESAADSIPYGQRNDIVGNPIANNTSGYQYPIGTPIVGDFDPDGEYEKPDIFVTTSQGAIFAFEYDHLAEAPNPRLYPKKGWPILLPDVPREPVLEQLDPVAHPGQFSLVVQCEDGFLHIFDLPTTSTSSVAPGWGSYGGDLGNTRSRLVGLPSNRPDTDGTSGGREGVRIGRLGSNPTRGEGSVVLLAEMEETVDLGVYDVGGRRVRTVFHGVVRPGATTLAWNGRSDTGSLVPSGVYWYRLVTRGGEQVRRMVLIR